MIKNRVVGLSYFVREFRRRANSRLALLIVGVLSFTILSTAQDGSGNGCGCSFATIRGTGSDVNDLGAIVGSYYDVSGHQHGYLLRNGKYTTIDDPHAVNHTSAEGINNYGRVVG